MTHPSDISGCVFRFPHRRGQVVCFRSKEAGIPVKDEFVVTLECDDPRIGPSFKKLEDAIDFASAECDGTGNYDW